MKRIKSILAVSVSSLAFAGLAAAVEPAAQPNTRAQKAQNTGAVVLPGTAGDQGGGAVTPSSARDTRDATSKTDGPNKNTGTPGGVGTNDLQPLVLSTLRTLHTDNQKEIEMGKLAQQKGTLSETKAFGRKLVSDHTAADKKVTALLNRRGGDDTAAAPAPDASAHDMSGLENKTGAQWDLAFANMMAADHEKTISMLKSARNDSSDKEFTQLLAALLPTLQKHQKLAERIVEKASKAPMSDAR